MQLYDKNSELISVTEYETEYLELIWRFWQGIHVLAYMYMH